IRVDVPWSELTDDERRWVIDAEGSWSERKWYGLARFFAWLEGRAYKMHIRVLLSKYRSYDLCPACEGARLKPESLLWRVGSLDDAAAVVDPAARFRPKNLKLDDAAFAKLPGLTIHDVMLLPLDRALEFFQGLRGNWCQTPFSEEGPRTSDDGGRKWCLTPIFAPISAPISAPVSAATELVL